MDILKTIIQMTAFGLLGGSFLYVNLAQAQRLRMLDLQELPDDQAHVFGTWRSRKLTAWAWGAIGWGSFCFLALGMNWLPNIVLLPVLAAMIAAATMSIVTHEKAMRLKKKVPGWLIEQAGNHIGRLKHAWIAPASLAVVLLAAGPFVIKALPITGKSAVAEIPRTAAPAQAPVSPDAAPATIASGTTTKQGAEMEDPFMDPAAR
jgi:hypothetical protein